MTHIRRVYSSTPVELPPLVYSSAQRGLVRSWRVEPIKQTSQRATAHSAAGSDSAMKLVASWAIGALAALALSASWGCGYEDTNEGAEGQEDEFGALEEQLSVNSSKYGISTASTHQTCRSDGPSGQDCLVPTSKAIQYCYSNAGGAWNATEISGMQAAISVLGGKFPGFTWVRVGNDTSVAQTNCANSALINKVQKGTCSGGSTGSNIESFVCYSPRIETGSVGTLTESLPGTWRSMLGGFITVDSADIAARPDLSCVKDFGLLHSLVAAAGFGNDSSVTTNTLITGRGVSTACNRNQSSGQEQCFALSVNPGGGGGGGFMSFNSAVCNP